MLMVFCCIELEPFGEAAPRDTDDEVFTLWKQDKDMSFSFLRDPISFLFLKACFALICAGWCGLFHHIYFFLFLWKGWVFYSQNLNPAPSFTLKYLCLWHLLWADGCPREGKGGSYECSTLQSICLRKCAESSNISGGFQAPWDQQHPHAWTVPLEHMAPTCFQKCPVEMHYVAFCCFSENKDLRVSRGFQAQYKCCSVDVSGVWQELHHKEGQFCFVLFCVVFFAFLMILRPWKSPFCVSSQTCALTYLEAVPEQVALWCLIERFLFSSRGH